MVASFMSGLQSPDLASLLIRLVMGSFFILSRFRYVWDPQHGWFSNFRQVKLTHRLCTCGYGRSVVLASLVAWTEIVAGVLLVIGLLTVPAAGALVIVMLFATACTARDECASMCPIDGVDWVCKYLYLCEPLYILLGLLVLILGAGSFSLDALLWR